MPGARLHGYTAAAAGVTRCVTRVSTSRTPSRDMCYTVTPLLYRESRKDVHAPMSARALTRNTPTHTSLESRCVTEVVTPFSASPTPKLSLRHPPPICNRTGRPTWPDPGELRLTTGSPSCASGITSASARTAPPCTSASARYPERTPPMPSTASPVPAASSGSPATRRPTR